MSGVINYKKTLYLNTRAITLLAKCYGKGMRTNATMLCSKYTACKAVGERNKELGLFFIDDGKISDNRRTILYPCLPEESTCDELVVKMVKAAITLSPYKAVDIVFNGCILGDDYITRVTELFCTICRNEDSAVRHEITVINGGC